MDLSDRIKGLLSHPRLPVFAALAAVLLCTPSLWLGFQWDDHYLRLVLMRPPLDPDWSRTALTVFSFYNGDEAFTRTAIENGTAPWWTTPKLQLAFLRPLTGLTHWLDFRLWEEQPWVMHVHSLLWFAAALVAAGVLYRRLLLPAWLAGLAILLFALDNGHGLPAVWIANRNACIGVFFGLLTLIAHDRWRRDGWQAGRALAPLALLLGLLSGEIALATVAYLLAYALFLDNGTWRARVSSLVPAALICVTWWIGYRLFGYGAEGSSMYIDPGARPVEFAMAAIERLPLLFFGQWAWPAEGHLLLSESAQDVMWLLAVGLMIFIGFLLWPLIRRDRLARFFALGMMLSLLPACATVPGDRLLFLAGFGGMGLLAQLVKGVRDGDSWLAGDRHRRRISQLAVWVLLLNHLILSPLFLLRATEQIQAFGDIVERAAFSLPSEPVVREQTFLLVNTPSTFISGYVGLVRVLDDQPMAIRMRALGSSIHPIEVCRTEEDAVCIRPEGGYLAPPGAGYPAAPEPQPWFDLRYMLPVFDPLFRDATPFTEGDQIELDGITAEIITVTHDGRPSSVEFSFDRGPDDPSLRWLKWEDGVFVPFTLPEVGESVILPAAKVPGFK